VSRWSEGHFLTALGGKKEGRGVAGLLFAARATTCASLLREERCNGTFASLSP
jgi:hypothetical protein